MDISTDICTCGSHLKHCIVVSDVVKKMVCLCSAILEQGVQRLWGASHSWQLHSTMHAAHAIRSCVCSHTSLGAFVSPM